MIERLLHKLSRYGPIAPAEAAALAAAATLPRLFSARQEIIRQYASPTESTLMLEGLAGRLVSLEDGAQQLTALHIPGDFIDLHGFVLSRLDHSIVALTDCLVTTFPHGALTRLTTEFPNLTRALWFLSVVDAAIHRQWLIAIGRRTAHGRVAHLVCELAVRYRDVGLADDRAFTLALTQAELADALCLSTVHVNRVIQDLRADGVLAWRRPIVEILDWPRLRDIGQFDATYLQVEPPPGPMQPGIM